MQKPLTWQELSALHPDFNPDSVNGDTNSQARLRLFGHRENEVQVILYRDNHAWCPYCQKIWLWLEEKRIPYRIEKVTMFCYGQKEDWYKRKVPSGMLPAVELKGQLITESDDIIIALEQEFGVLYRGMLDPEVIPLRRLERLLFRAWCNWLCRQARFPFPEKNHQEQFREVALMVESALDSSPSPYFLAEFSTADLVFIPYVERMNASLYYYKGYSLTAEHPKIEQWFRALETRATYRGTQSDFHTHAHDLPPQMGGCWENGTIQAQENQQRVDQGSWFDIPDVYYPAPDNARQEALYRVIKHKDNIIKVNPANPQVMDLALRSALTYMMTGEMSAPTEGADEALRYLRDRINVPRDMSIHASKYLRTALEKTASVVGAGQGKPIPFNHRRDQDPLNFR